jgi:hypothetical protein
MDRQMSKDSRSRRRAGGPKIKLGEADAEPETRRDQTPRGHRGRGSDRHREKTWRDGGALERVGDGETLGKRAPRRGPAESAARGPSRKAENDGAGTRSPKAPSRGGPRAGRDKARTATAPGRAARGAHTNRDRRAAKRAQRGAAGAREARRPRAETARALGGPSPRRGATSGGECKSRGRKRAEPRPARRPPGRSREQRPASRPRGSQHLSAAPPPATSRTRAQRRPPAMTAARAGGGEAGAWAPPTPRLPAPAASRAAPGAPGTRAPPPHCTLREPATPGPGPARYMGACGIRGRRRGPRPPPARPAPCPPPSPRASSPSPLRPPSPSRTPDLRATGEPGSPSAPESGQVSGACGGRRRAPVCKSSLAVGGQGQAGDAGRFAAWKWVREGVGPWPRHAFGGRNQAFVLALLHFLTRA